MSHFISEVSSNHHRDLDRCYQFIDVSAEIGCDSVKFQLFKIDQLFSKEVLSTRPDVAARKDWELPIEFLPKLAQRCEEKNIEFSCTPFYLDAVDELEDYVSYYKIASYSLLHDTLLDKCARTNKPVVLSTGMADLNEIAHAVDVLSLAGCQDITLLQCVSSYPSLLQDSNLAVIKTLRDKFNCSAGWSDHSVNPGVIYRAVNFWNASTIEFHLDLDGHGEEFAAGHCWLPKDISEVIKNIKAGYLADGDGIKVPATSEGVERKWRADPVDGIRPLKEIRKSLVTT